MVKRNPYNYAKLFGGLGTLDLRPFGGLPIDRSSEPDYYDRIETIEMTPEKFASSIRTTSTGSISVSGGRFISFEKKTRRTEYPAILVSKAVYNGYKAESPMADNIVNKWWEKEIYKVKDVTEDVYGANLTWVL